MIPPTERTIAWADGEWLHAPPEAVTNGELAVSAAESSDFWRTTAYGFVHDDGHGLLRPFDPGTAVEVTFRLDYDQQFDQAGVLVRADERHWAKAGVEVVDGVPQLGAVVTHEVSDWSSRPVPEWHGAEVTIRVSRARDALTVRARPAAGEWQFVRLAPWPEGLDALAGPYCCAPDAGRPVRPLHLLASRSRGRAPPRVGAPAGAAPRGGSARHAADLDRLIYRRISTAGSAI